MDEEPAKMSLTNLVTGRTLEAQFNPTKIKAKLAAEYERLAILGFSSQPLQFKNTTNLEIDGVDLLFDRLTSQGGGGGGDNYDSARRYLLSLPLPRAGDSVIRGGPPDVLFVWPNIYVVVCRVMEVSEGHERMARDGRSTLMVHSVKLHSFTQFRLLGEDVEESGFEVLR